MLTKMYYFAVVLGVGALVSWLIGFRLSTFGWGFVVPFLAVGAMLAIVGWRTDPKARDDFDRIVHPKRSTTNVGKDDKLE